MGSIYDLSNSEIGLAEKKKIIINFVNSQIDPEKVGDIMKDFVPFSNKGRSGAKIGTLKDKKDLIVKYNKYRNKSFVKYKLDCIYLTNNINELLINYVFANYQKFNDFTPKEKTNLNKHLLKMRDFAIDKNEVIVVTPKIGIRYGKRNFTNFTNIQLSNLKIISGTPNMLVEYQKFLTNRIVIPIDRALKILNQKLGYVNTDMKLDNIFVREGKNSGYQILRDNGLIVDFSPLIADLDKANIELGGTKILVNDNFFSTSIATRTRLSPLADLRTSCRNKYGRIKCSYFDEGDFDILTVATALYITFYDKKMTHLPDLDKWFLRRFNLKEDQLDTFKDMILNKKKKLVNRIYMSIDGDLNTYFLSMIIFSFCQYLDRVNI